VFNNFLPDNRAICEIVLNIVVEQEKPLMAIERMRSACWTSKATDWHS